MKEGCKNAECLDATFSFLPSLFSAQSPLCGTDVSGDCLNTTGPCEDVLLFCSLCRSSQSSRASAVRLCLSLQLVETQLPTHRKTFGFPSAPLLCNPLHLASKVVGQTFPLDSLKMPSMNINPHGFIFLLRHSAKTKTTSGLVSLKQSPAALLLSLPCSR